MYAIRSYYVIAAGGVTTAVSARLLSYFQAAVDAGACAILNTCSSVGDSYNFV